MWNIFFSRSMWVLLKLVRRWTQHFTKIDREKHKIEQICIWNPMSTGFIMHWLTSSIQNFCHWVADVTPRKTSLAAKNKEKQLYLHASYVYYLALSSLNLTPYFLDLARCISQFQGHPSDYLDGQHTCNSDFDHNFSK